MEILDHEPILKMSATEVAARLAPADEAALPERTLKAFGLKYANPTISLIPLNIKRHESWQLTSSPTLMKF